MPRRHPSNHPKPPTEQLRPPREHRPTQAGPPAADRDAEASRAGRVMARHGAHLAVEAEDGSLYHCVSRRVIGHPVCGDRVRWRPTGLGSGIVTALESRGAVLSRTDLSGRGKPLAANLSLLMVVLAPEPAPSGDLLDQYLVCAERMGIDAWILLTKLDLLEAGARRAFSDTWADYARIGYPLLGLSACWPDALARLAERLRDQTAILVGQSGVGKSSLAAALLPDRAVQIGRLSRATGLGRHTTSAATCYRLPNGGALIDAPGVRSFRLDGLSVAQIEQSFREFAPFLGRCRFSNCAHRDEPDCALRAAVAAGQIDARRFASFQRLANTALRA